jgi:hypothetical protein
VSETREKGRDSFEIATFTTRVKNCTRVRNCPGTLTDFGSSGKAFHVDSDGCQRQEQFLEFSLLEQFLEHSFQVEREFEAEARFLFQS